MLQAKAKIFLADERGLDETASFCSRNTFNFGTYRHEHKQAFGDMYVLNDDVLDGGCSSQMQALENSVVILLPVIGAVSFETSFGERETLAAGQVQFLMLGKDDKLEITNPFEEEPVNFLQVWIRVPGPEQHASLLSGFDVNKFLNSLMKISPQRLVGTVMPFTISIGKFSGRGETVYYPSRPDAGVFLFVLEGAFEAEGRLLHPRDGLALYDTAQIEVEALSQDAILLIIELPFTFLVD